MTSITSFMLTFMDSRSSMTPRTSSQYFPFSNVANFHFVVRILADVALCFHIVEAMPYLLSSLFALGFLSFLLILHILVFNFLPFSFKFCALGVILSCSFITFSMFFTFSFGIRIFVIRVLIFLIKFLMLSLLSLVFYS